LSRPFPLFPVSGPHPNSFSLVVLGFQELGRCARVRRIWCSYGRAKAFSFVHLHSPFGLESGRVFFFRGLSLSLSFLSFPFVFVTLRSISDSLGPALFFRWRRLSPGPCFTGSFFRHPIWTLLPPVFGYPNPGAISHFCKHGYLAFF